MTYRKRTISHQLPLTTFSGSAISRLQISKAKSVRTKVFMTFMLFLFSVISIELSAMSHEPFRNNSKLKAQSSMLILADSLTIYGDNVSGNIGDIVTVNFKADNFVDVSSLDFSVNWNNSLVQFNSIVSVGILGANTGNFDISNANTGAITFSWNNLNQTLPNGTSLFKISFKVLKGGKSPIKISITDIPTTVSATQFGLVPYQIKTTAGTVSVLGACNSRSPGLKCSDAPLLCQSEFPYCATLPDTNSITNPGNQCGKVDNNVWVSFKPATTAISFKINTINCVGTKPAADGLQVSVYTTNNCINFTKISCNPSISRLFSTFQIDLTNLTIDTQYYIMVDGNNGDICDFTLDIVSGKVHGNGTTPPTFTAPDSVCAYQSPVACSINNPEGANQYQWRLGAGASAILPNPTIANSVKVFWGATADSVCARTITPCDTSTWACKLIALRKSYVVTDNKTKCAGSSIVWNGTTYSNPGDYGPVTLKSLAGCDSIVTLHLTDFTSTPRVIDTTVCGGTNFVFLGQTYTTAGSYTNLKAAQKNYLGCDSLITLNLTFLTADKPGISKSNDLTCQLKTAQLIGNLTGLIPSNATSVFEWRNSSNVLVKTGNSLAATVPDTYTLNITLTSKNVSCVISSNVTVKNSGSLPPKPIIVAPTTLCGSQINSFTASNTDSDTKAVTWTATNASVQTAGLTGNITPTANNVQVCASITNSCGVGDTSCIIMTTLNAPSGTDFVGVFTACPASTQNYIITQSQTGTTYNWAATNGTIIGSNSGSTVQVKWNNTDGKICVTASNGCGNPLQVCKDVKISNSSANQNPIVGKSSFCANESLTYSIAAGATDKVQWSFPNGMTAQSKIDSSVLLITANNSFTSGKICVHVVNSCSVSSDTCLQLSISNTTPDSVPITFNNSICSDDTSTFTLNTPTNYTAVNWNLPNGAKIVSGANTKTIRVVWQNALLNAPLSVAYSNNCNLSRSSTIQVTVKDAVINAPNIDGPKLACPKTRSTYSIPQQSNVISYTWHMPAGATIEGKSDSNVIKIFWDSPTTGDICVDLQNACKVKKSVCLNVEVRSTIDSLPINGNYSVCADSVGTFSVSSDANVDSYFWKPPVGAKIMSGASTNQVTIKFPSGSSGYVCCYPNGGCADGTKSCFYVAVNDPPALPTKISGNSSVCIGDTVQYSIEPQPGTLGINWRIPKNLEVLAGLFSKTIIAVVLDTLSGSVCVSPQGNCKNTKEVCLSVLASKLPEPIIVSDTSVCSRNFSLTVKATGKVQWRLIQSPNGGTATFAQPSGLTTQISTNTGGLFVFGVTETNGNCKKEVTVKVTVRPAPVISNLVSQCTREADFYSISFNMSSPTAQRFVVNGSTLGSVLGNTYSSFLIKQNTPYWFVVTDDTGCASDTIRGQVNCPCYSSAGSIVASNAKDVFNASIPICFGDSIKITKTSNSALDRNDTEEFILYSNAANGTKQIVQRNKTGIFTFDNAKMKRDSVYTIQLLVGDSLKSSIVDTTARCVSYSSNSIKVSFRNKYKASIAVDSIVCPFAIASAKFSTSAPSNVSFTVTDAIGSLGFFNVKNGAKFDIRPSKSGYLKLLNPKDEVGCSVDALDSAFVNVRALPVSLPGSNQAICARSTTLKATVDTTLVNGRWESSNSAIVVSPKSATTQVTNLENGKNAFVWIVSDKVCPTFEVRDSVNVFLPYIPKTNALALVTKVGVPISANLVQEAPNGSYTITRLNDPNAGRFDFFSDGKFNYIPDNKFVGIVKFKFVICSAICNTVCDTSEVRILINSDSIPINPGVDTIQVPNAITPNGDGKNDYLQIDHLSDYPSNELIIFNRWGETVFRAQPYNNDWSGNNQSNSPLPVGTYYYLLRLDVNNGKILKGDITILRN